MLSFQNAGDYEVTPAPGSVLLEQVCTQKESKDESAFGSEMCAMNGTCLQVAFLQGLRKKLINIMLR